MKQLSESEVEKFLSSSLKNWSFDKGISKENLSSKHLLRLFHL